MKNINDKITQAVLSGDLEGVRTNVQTALEWNYDVTDILNNGLLKAMHIIGNRFERNEIYVTELLVSARGVHEGINVIRPYLMERGESLPRRGKIVIGTVAGDLHDIGKNLLGLMLEARGFEVIDLGVDVSATAFVEAVSRHQPDVLCLSALLTTTVKAVGSTIEALSGVKQSGHRVNIVVGGAALREEIASALGADGYAPDAVSGANLIEEMVQREQAYSSGHTLAGAYGLDEIESLQVAFSADRSSYGDRGSPRYSFCGRRSFCLLLSKM